LIHKYRLTGYNIVIDVASGAVHVPDDCAFDVLDHYPQRNADETVETLTRYPADEVRSCITEIDALAGEGLLFTQDVPAPAGLTGGHVVKALCIHAAHDCNLRCAYCFAGKGGYHGARGLMPLETGLAAVDFLIANSGNRRNLEIDFFGGEPLMNFDVVKQITFYCKEQEQARGKKFRFTLTTNGVLLDDESIDFINEHMDNVVLSLDGRKDVNDRMRGFANGRGSYDVVLPKFQRLVSERGHRDYYIRGTYTRGNMDFAEDVKHLAALEFKYISVEPAASPETEAYALKLTDADALCGEYERLARYILETAQVGDPVEFFHFKIDLEGGPCVRKRVSGCGAGSEYFAVAPDGGLYPCHQFAGMGDFKVGDVFGGLNGSPLLKKFAETNLYSIEKCADCWARYYCGGGCAANAHNISGDIGVPYELGCVLHRKRCECAIMLKAAGV